MAQKKEMPTKKGGKVFPRFDLEFMEKIAEKLVSKSHSKALPKEIYYSAGVLGVKGSRANKRASALKQYGFVEGTVKDGVSASQLAKALVNAVPEEKQQYRRHALLNPTIFEKLYRTFQGDTVSIHKIRQQAAALKVHPDNAEQCAKIFVESAVFAGLAERAGEEVTLKLLNSPEVKELANDSEGLEDTGVDGDDEGGSDEVLDEGDTDLTPDDPEAKTRATPRAIVNVSLTVDSSMDVEKLERQMETLRRYGVI